MKVALSDFEIRYYYTFTFHSFCSQVDELSTEVKESLKPQRKEAEELFDKWSAVMKEATITLSNWDTETEQGVRAIDDTAQKQVEYYGPYPTLC